MKNKKKKLKIFKQIDFKKGISRAKESFMEKLSMPNELTYEWTKITMLENKEIFIEGKNSIVDYYDNYIKIQTNNIYIILDGKNLKINDINDYELLISGNISNVGYISR